MFVAERSPESDEGKVRACVTPYTRKLCKEMKTNIHSMERLGRIFIGAGLTSLAFWGPTNYWFLLGLIPLATGLIGWCPPYALLGISTCSAKSSSG